MAVPPTSRPRAPRPSLRVAISLLVLGVVAAIVAGVGLANGLIHTLDNATLVSGPGTVQVQCRTGTYLLYVENGSPAVSGLPSSVVVTGPGGAAVPLQAQAATETVTRYGQRFSGQLGFSVVTAGSYTVAVHTAGASLVVAPSFTTIARENLGWGHPPAGRASRRAHRPRLPRHPPRTALAGETAGCCLPRRSLGRSAWLERSSGSSSGPSPARLGTAGSARLGTAGPARLGTAGSAWLGTAGSALGTAGSARLGTAERAIGMATAPRCARWLAPTPASLRLATLTCGPTIAGGPVTSRDAAVAGPGRGRARPGDCRAQWLASAEQQAPAPSS